MPIMNLLVAFNGSEASIAALRYAASMARARDAHVTAMMAHSTHDVFDTRSRWIPSEARKLLSEAKAGILHEIEARYEALRDELDLGDALSFQSHPGKVDATLSEAARYYDMIIVGRQLDEDDEHVALHPDRIALLSGRPVIVVPDGYDIEARHSHAALAWDGGRSAARALSDSLRLLEVQGRVSVLTVGKKSGFPIEDLMTHLARHDVEALHDNFPDSHPVAETILAFCERNDPSLLVMGAYEHSKFREDFLGGVTAKVLQDIRIPVLLSH
ncbi:universal stress protein family protein [Primorskyibacter sedentarius]|uniref:Universal stress protein family protein n=1 Tax=Primorskyibacter sedentarius TaxID=745311 RepID=A0A4V2UPG4_9RHOB|nr:universal stress protein [Primorskyibacter sedentarius]TCS65791.1 universal stress protein family protein [Primorskyibacter sedentarius]